MNRAVVLFHLREAAEQLKETIQNLESSGDYDKEEFLFGFHPSSLPPFPSVKSVFILTTIHKSFRSLRKFSVVSIPRFSVSKFFCLRSLRFLL